MLGSAACRQCCRPVSIYGSTKIQSEVKALVTITWVKAFFFLLNFNELFFKICSLKIIIKLNHPYINRLDFYYFLI